MKYMRWFVLFMLGTNVGIAMFQFYTYIFVDIVHNVDKISLNLIVGGVWFAVYLGLEEED